MKFLLYSFSLVLLLLSSCTRCKDSEACNNGAKESCEYFSCRGCTDPQACNYDSEATQDNQSCTYYCNGCTDPLATNYESWATIDNGSCNYGTTNISGCMDVNSCNYDANATVDDGTCEYTSCAGCTDQTARNYDTSATIDDGSCNYNCTTQGVIGSLWVNKVPAQNVNVRFDILVDGQLRLSTVNKFYTTVGSAVTFESTDYSYNMAAPLNVINFGSNDMTMTVKLYIDNVLVETTDHSTCYIGGRFYIQGNTVPNWYTVGGSSYTAGIEFESVQF